MKLATYILNDRESYGLVVDGGVVDMPTACPKGPPTALAALQAGEEALGLLKEMARLRPTAPLDAVRLLAPLPAPPKVIGLAVNYAEHHREFDRGQDLPDDPRRRTTPRPFLMPATAVTGPNTTIPWPVFSRQIDYEVELAVVIGRPTARVTPAEAAGCLFGYTIANDVSARSATFAEGRQERPKDAFFDWLHGKWADGFCPLGPWIVSADDLGDPRDLAIECLVNGQIRQSARTGAMIFDVYELVSFISHIMTLTPGDVIATGTPSGVGMATGRLLQGGDTITCRIEGIGELTNTLGPPPEAFYAPRKA